MNSIIWIMACNRLFILMSPWGGGGGGGRASPVVVVVFFYLCVCVHGGVQFYGGIPENPDLDE